MPRLLVRQALLVLALAGCARRPAPAPLVTSGPMGGTDVADARATVAAFLDAEAAGNTAADTLLAPGATFVMTGLAVTARPRLAGLNGPGQAAIEEASIGLAGGFAWVVAVYRFTGRTPGLGERARATFVLEKQRAGWSIRHVHSSMVARW